MRRTALLACTLLLAAACAPETEPVRGLQVRLHLDRAQARVGDRIGVTVEIDTPAGFSVARPDPPGHDVFLTESIEQGESLELAGGLRHRVLWTLRAKQVGEQSLPSLFVPLVHPDGRIEPLPVAGVPFSVLSVRAELPEQEVFFDLREAPPVRGPRAPWIAGGAIAAIVASLVAAVWWRRHHGVLGEAADPRLLATAALEAMADARAIADPRLRADGFAQALHDYVRARWSLEIEGVTPAELGEPVAPPLIEVLRGLDAERFAAEARAEPVDRGGAEARAWLQDAVGD
ncbi:MAG: hypothetical protein JRG76_00415 [Deltaproteobacteria bacterium]|nr:hypothetical protein [Deltaproteobacteria bacterium]MBW2412943.1 hypothetical protein [Deltaproteobacteria bacterium]